MTIQNRDDRVVGVYSVGNPKCPACLRKQISSRLVSPGSSHRTDEGSNVVQGLPWWLRASLLLTTASGLVACGPGRLPECDDPEIVATVQTLATQSIERTLGSSPVFLQVAKQTYEWNVELPETLSRPADGRRVYCRAQLHTRPKGLPQLNAPEAYKQMLDRRTEIHYELSYNDAGEVWVEFYE